MTALLTKLAFFPPRIPADTAAVTYRNADFISAPCVVTVTLVSGWSFTRHAAILPSLSPRLSQGCASGFSASVKNAAFTYNQAIKSCLGLGSLLPTPADQVTCEGTEKALLDNPAGWWILFLPCMMDKEVFQGNSNYRSNVRQIKINYSSSCGLKAASKTDLTKWIKKI